MCCLFAATYPARTTALILYGTYAKRTDPDDDYPWVATREQRQAYGDQVEREWGFEADLGTMAPNADAALTAWWRARARASASPGAARALILMNSRLTSATSCSGYPLPTLVLQRSATAMSEVEHGRYIAEHIPGARFVEFPGVTARSRPSTPTRSSTRSRSFSPARAEGPKSDRVLATVLFTDIVGSTERAAAMGDRAWLDLLDRYYGAVRREVGRLRGREIDTAGDGFFVTFDGPARAIRCACRRSAAPCARSGSRFEPAFTPASARWPADKIGGIAVHVGARIVSLAGAGEILVSSTVRDLVTGSGLEFADRGSHALKGVPGEWRLSRWCDYRGPLAVVSTAGEGRASTSPLPRLAAHLRFTAPGWQ